MAAAPWSGARPSWPICLQGALQDPDPDSVFAKREHFCRKCAALEMLHNGQPVLVYSFRVYQKKKISIMIPERISPFQKAYLRVTQHRI